MRRYIHWLVVASKKIQDAYSKGYSWRMVLVPRPVLEAPFPCILLTISNGHNKIMLRFKSLEEYEQAFHLSVEDITKINLALAKANQEAMKLEEDIKLLFEKRNLAPGSQIVNTGTGQVLAQAEEILRGDNDGSR